MTCCHMLYDDDDDDDDDIKEANGGLCRIGMLCVATSSTDTKHLQHSAV